MKGLLIKDFYVIKKILKLYFFIDLVFIFIVSLAPSFDINSFTFIIYPCICVLLVITSLLVYDEYDRWNVYERTLPYSPSDIVSSKYVCGLLVTAATLLLIIIIYSVSAIFRAEFDITRVYNISACIIFASLMPASFMVPIMYKVGAIKSRPIGLTVNFIITGLTSGVAYGSIAEGAPLNVNINLILIIFAMIIYAVSWLISIKIYKSKDI